MAATHGRLTRPGPAAIADGMAAAATNARRLLADAQLLLKAGRWPSAAALAVAEARKPAALRALAAARTEAQVAQAWRRFRSGQGGGTRPIHAGLLERDWRPADG